MRTIASFVVVVASLATLPCSLLAAEKPGAAAYLEGIEALEKGRYKEAVAAFAKAIEAHGENPDYFTARGVANTLAEQFQLAIGDLKRSLALRDGKLERETRVWLGVAHRMSGNAMEGAKHFTHGKEMPIDYASFIYNDMAMAYWQGRQTGQFESARTMYPRAATWFAERAKGGAAAAETDLGVDLLARARQRLGNRDFAGGIADAEAVLRSRPDEPNARLVRAWARLYLNDAAAARFDFTRLLIEYPNLADCYLGRALALARLGRADAADRDLVTAALLDKDRTEKFIAAVRDEMDKLRDLAPTARPDELLAELLKLAREGAADAKLIEAAIALRRAMNNSRRYLDESYQERLRELELAMKDLPDNPFPIAEFADFLHRNLFVRSERVEPRGSGRYYRHHTVATRNAELGRIEMLCDRALKLDDACPKALRIKASLHIGRNEIAAARMLLERLVEAKEITDPDVPLMLNRVCSAEAADLRAKAHKLRNPEFIEPSDLDLKDAARMEAEAAEKVDLGRKFILAAAKALEGTARGEFLLACLHRMDRQPQLARQRFEKAVELDPAYDEAFAQLAGTLEELNLPDEAVVARSRGLNLVHTSAMAELQRVWPLVKTSRYQSARKLLDRALQLDPTDARGTAYLAVIAKADGKTDEAIALCRAALALEEARIRERGTSFQADAKAILPADEFGMTMTLRLWLGKELAAQGKHAEALPFLRANAAIAARLPRGGGEDALYSGMIPDPALDSTKVPEADTPLLLTAWSELHAGRALVALKRNAEAEKAFTAVMTMANEFRPVHRSEQREPLRSLNDPRAFAAISLARLAIAKGDTNAARRYLNQAGSWSREAEAERKQVEAELRSR